MKPKNIDGLNINNQTKPRQENLQEQKVSETSSNELIVLSEAPKIDGLIFRHFRGEADYPGMITIWSTLRQAGHFEGSNTVEDLAIDYRHLYNCDPAKDMIFAEVNGEMVAYSRVWWDDESNCRVYYHFIHILPAYKGKGIESALLKWVEQRLLEISWSQPGEQERFYVQTCSQNDTTLYNLLAENGYKPIRYYYSMSRTLEDIPEAELPEGIVARPPMPSQYHEVWERANEAFSEHWGFVEGHEEDYQSWKEGRWFQPLLWQIAWDGNTMVSQVQNYVDEVENESTHRLRGYTEGISTLKAWRGKGIARALIVRSMKMMKALNLTEVALTVDSENATGALNLYESLGYRTYRTVIEMRKPMNG